jgi:integrase
MYRHRHNPMELVTVKGSSKRRRKPRSLTVAELQRFIVHLDEPFRTMALLSICFGLRISECLALKWSDVDWLNSKLSVQRGIVKQNVDDVKTLKPLALPGDDDRRGHSASAQAVEADFSVLSK